MSRVMYIGIAGAGLLGRLLALQLSRAGHVVEVFDPAQDANARFAHEHPATPQAAAFTAAGMLSPIAELDNAEPEIAALGWRSIALWQDLIASLPEPKPMLKTDGSLLLAHRGDEGAAQRVLQRIATAQQSHAWQQALPEYTGVQKLSPAQLQALEPTIAGVAQSWLLSGEGMIDTVATLQALYRAAPTVRWHWGVHVNVLTQMGELLLADGSRHQFDRVIDVRGTGAKSSMTSLQVRGVRGETVWLHAPAHGLARPVRLLHPRHRVYIVPRDAETIIIGASEIESEDYSPVSLRTALELMSAAHSVLPDLAEARILRLDSNCRPATSDNNPVLQWQGNLLTINGLFRHGWLLAPALVERALGAFSHQI